MMEKIIIHGCGGHAKSVANVILCDLDYEIVFVDVNAREGETIFGCPVYSSIERIGDWRSSAHHIGVGCIAEREALFDKYKREGCYFPAIISDSAGIAPSASVAEGVFIGFGAYVGPNAVIGANAVINTRAVVEHDSTVGAHSHVSVNSTLAGYVKTGERVFIGAGAVVIDKISIIDDVIIGAGAAVVSDIEQPGTYVGVPARGIN